MTAGDPAYGPAVAVIVLIVILSVAVLVYGLLRASMRPDPALVVTSLSVLTLVSIVAYATTKLEILGGLAATGFGALSGAVAGLYNRKQEEGNSDHPN